VVERELGPTQSTGFEDDEDFNVLLDEPEADDEVNLVSKRTGELHRELYFGNEDRLEAMTPVGS
jgi:hypothetical protein